MDLVTARGRVPAPWFPRPRGDGPEVLISAYQQYGVSPPTRGWTRRMGWPRVAVPGFPAHAGMDPATMPAMTGRPWFPRPRGDGPMAEYAIVEPQKVSPPTRGWTRVMLRICWFHLGFPAHAGMDRVRDDREHFARGFPRPRGDGPLVNGMTSELDRVSPPTRGWTLVAVDSRCAGRGFPAHAGMDPSSRTCSVPSAWFPRPRGDGPYRT